VPTRDGESARSVENTFEIEERTQSESEVKPFLVWDLRSIDGARAADERSHLAARTSGKPDGPSADAVGARRLVAVYGGESVKKFIRKWRTKPTVDSG
jgi:hypothetical protein